ncbi:formylmethanofuran dehydrogenase subunit C [Singulisphaera sp. PoT]|uniref:formylmethanofuran dehydrogenase subunit C n=1 Tax=Singulisphaera sp. PoT TaxID=3411797 RepID=UPI003BF489D1
MPLTLRWRATTRLTIDATGLVPENLAGLSSSEISSLALPIGNGKAEIGELFVVEGDLADGHLVLEGDLQNVRRIGRKMASGTLTVKGDVGTEAGAEMTGGMLTIAGNVGHWAGAEMRGGLIRIKGNAGDYLGSAFPGSRLGMRDGVILVEGDAGVDVGHIMRRGMIAVGGRSGDGLGRGMVAGSIFTFGEVGRRLGAGMKRGTLALFGAGTKIEESLLPTFVPSGHLRPPFLNLYLKRLMEWGFPVPEATFSGRLQRYNGDLVEGGQGEILAAI